MVTLLGFYEKGWLDNKTEKFIWKQLRHAYGVDQVILTDNIEEALLSLEGEVVLLEPKGDIMLHEFKHPENVIYVFGNAMNHNLKLDGVKVRIDTPTMTDMFAFNAAAIVLESRINERRQQNNIE